MEKVFTESFTVECLTICRWGGNVELDPSMDLNMVVSRSKFKKIKEIVERKMQGIGPSHDFSHVLRVLKLAREIAKSEKNIDSEVLELSAILHDIERKKEDLDDTGKVDHAIDSARTAGKILERFNFPADKIEKIKECIISHRFKTNYQPRSVEAKILADADRLDVMGAIGIARCACWIGENNATIYSETPLIDYVKKNLLDGVRNGRIKDKSKHALNFEYELKLKNIHKRLFTKRAREIARKKLKIMKLFFKQLEEEAKI